MRPFFKQYRNEQLVCCVTCGINGVRGLRRARGAQGVRGTWTVAVQGVHLRAAALYERRVRHAGQMHDNLNITLKCEDTFFVYPERVQELLEI